MIKVYLDWNIMSSIKRGGLPVLESIFSNKNKFIIPYSTAHIGDLLASHTDDQEQQKRIVEDLNYISKITDNHCFFNDGKGNIQLGFWNPNDLYQQQFEFKDFFKDFSVDKLFDSFINEDDDEELFILINSLKKILKSIPLDNSFKDAFDNPETSKELEKMFPDLKENLTFEGFFKSFGKMFHNLNESEDYKGLREAVQKIGVNSGHYSKGKDPYDIIKNAYYKIGANLFEPNNLLNSSKNTPIWFNELSNEYILLDMHGFKQDQIKVDGRTKKTFRNTTDDAFHSAFASRCDFYITNDKKNSDKTKIIYDNFKVETLVLTPNEFINHYNSYLNKHGLKEHFDDLFDIIESGKDYIQWGQETDENNQLIGFVGISYHHFFDFFNKVRICISEDCGIFYLLTKEYSSNFYFIAYKELDNLIRMFIEYFGPDDNEKQYYNSDEMTDLNWDGRTWTLNSAKISLKRLNGWFQLYIYPTKN
jgi:hypothetical protein